MQVHILTPYSVTKDLGKAYNTACSLIPDGDWCCIMDYDCMLLTPDAGKIIHEYAERGEQALYTCYTNRCHPTSPQLYNDILKEPDITKHIKLAEYISQRGNDLLRITGNVSGFLMMFPKSLWLKYKFDEGVGCLGLDTSLWKRLAADKVPMYIMQRLYVFHIYRLTLKGKEHLL